MCVGRTVPEAIWKQVTLKSSTLERVIDLLCILETIHDMHKIIIFKKSKERKEKPELEYCSSWKLGF